MKLSEFLVQVFGSERSNDEFDQLKAWKNEGELNAMNLQEMSVLHAISDDLSDYQAFDVEAGLAATMAEIGESESPSKGTSYKILLIAAITMLALAASFGVYKYVMDQPQQYYADAEILQSSLEDGTVFTLNDAASLTFDETNNSMTLKGEAFFDVVKQDVPLLINTSMGQIKVLGTSFNVKSNEEETEVFMYEGVIEYSAAGTRSIKVSRGEGIVVSTAGVEKFSSTNTQVYNYWIDKSLSYKNSPLTNVLSDLERLFNKDYSELKNKNQDLTVTANFNENTEQEILEELAVITGIKL